MPNFKVSGVSTYLGKALMWLSIKPFLFCSQFHSSPSLGGNWKPSKYNLTEQMQLHMEREDSPSPPPCTHKSIIHNAAPVQTLDLPQ